MNAIAANPVSQSLAVRPHEGHGLAYAELEKVAASIAESGLFGIKTKSQAMALMMISIAEGRHPALAARDYDIVQNRPAKKAEAMLRDFLQGGGTVKWHALTDNEADATFTHPAGGTVRINWNMERAAKAGLATKENYKKFARQMLRSRTVSEGVRTVYPLATSGMYVPEEAADITNPPDTFNGPTLEARPEPPAPKPQRKAEAPPPVPPTETTDPGGNGDAPKPARKFADLMEAIDIHLAGVQSLDDYNAVVQSPDAVAIMERGNAKQREALEEHLKPVRARFMPQQTAMTLDAEPWDRETGEITPADRLASG